MGQLKCKSFLFYYSIPTVRNTTAMEGIGYKSDFTASVRNPFNQIIVRSIVALGQWKHHPTSFFIDETVTCPSS